MNHRAPRRTLLLALALTAVPGVVSAELPTLIPRAVIFGNPERISPNISPDGTRLAWIAPDKNNVQQVWVKTIGKDDDRILTADKKRGIRQYLWAWNNEDLLYLQDNDGDENFHIYGANLKSGETRDLTPVLGVRAFPQALEPNSPDQLLVSMNRRNRALFDVWRLDLKTGSLTMAAENPGGVGNWVTDGDMKVRGAEVLKPEGGGEFRVRDSESAPWRTLAAWGIADQFNAIDFSRDGRTVTVQTNVGADTIGLYAMDAATGKMTKIASDPGVDLGNVFENPVTRVVQAVSFHRDRERWKVLDPSVARDFEALGKAAPGDFNVINRDLRDKTWLVIYVNDTSPVKYYSWDRTAQKATYLFSARPLLEKYTLAPMKPVEIRSRDGLMLPSYLTAPAGVPTKGLPMVLWVHGGPWVRDQWGYDPYAQWFANRGYVALQVNYRGSQGFGKKFRNAAIHEFAGKMHDDLVDAVRWAIAEGIADPKKIAIMGGSYGGYATLVGVTFTPDLFACGVDIVGPSSLASLIESFPPYWGPYLSNTWYPFVGNPKDSKDRAAMDARSPLFRADKIKVPLLIGQGGNDPRVTAKESEQIVAAIEKNKGSVTYVVYSDEGHGFARPENRIDFNARSEKFLAGCLAGRFEAMEGDRIPGSTAVVRVVGR
ncbi:MAG: S9 family peptidase [Thermoanaerobaculia bacterium]|jgi:dipeptidyl aminopeptidase/acylaminoacyl peptidase